MSKKVTLTATPRGIDVEADGFHGEGCKAVIDGIVQAMGPGVEPEDQDNKPEFYETEKSTSTERA